MLESDQGRGIYSEVGQEAQITGSRLASNRSNGLRWYGRCGDSSVYLETCTGGHVPRDMYRPASSAQTVKPELFTGGVFGSSDVRRSPLLAPKTFTASTGSSTLGDREKVGVGVVGPATKERPRAGAGSLYGRERLRGSPLLLCLPLSPQLISLSRSPRPDRE